MNLRELKDYEDHFRILEECKVNGKFINENSMKISVRDAFIFVQNHKITVREYFRLIGYDVICGNGYCYFTQHPYELKDIPVPFKKFLIDYIDIHLLLLQAHASFSSKSNYLLNINSFADKISSDIELGNIADKITSISKGNRAEFSKKLFDKLTKDGFIEVIDQKEGNYRLMKSYEIIELAIMEIKEYE